MQPQTARMDLAGCLAIWLDRGSLSCTAPPEKKSAEVKFSGARSEADQKLQEN